MEIFCTFALKICTAKLYKQPVFVLTLSRLENLVLTRVTEK